MKKISCPQISWMISFLKLKQNKVLFGSPQQSIFRLNIGNFATSLIIVSWLPTVLGKALFQPQADSLRVFALKILVSGIKLLALK